MRTLADQVRTLSHEYVRHGSKASRRKRVTRLCNAVTWIATRFPMCRRVEQIGRKQIWHYYAAHTHLTPKTLQEYEYAFQLLWELLNRRGQPPSPLSEEKTCEST